MSYQKAFTQLEANFKQTLEFIQSFHSSTENPKQQMMQLFHDSKTMALPQSYNDLILFINNLNNLTHSFYVMILAQQGLQSNRESLFKNKFQRNISTPTLLVKSQSHFASQQQSQKAIKRSSSITQLNQFLLFQNPFKETSTAAESEFKQDLSTRNINSPPNIGQSDQMEVEIKINGQNNIFNFSNSENNKEDAQEKNFFGISENCNSSNNNNTHNYFTIANNNTNYQQQENQSLFKFNIPPNNSMLQNQLATNLGQQLSNNLTINVNPFFGLSQEQSSRSSSIRSSHFNEDNDNYNSPLSNPYNANAFTAQQNPSQITNQSSFNNQYNFKNTTNDSDSQNNKNELTRNLQISNFQSNDSQDCNKFDHINKSPFIMSDNEETALPTFRSQQMNQIFDFSHTPTIQYGNSEQQN